MTGKRPYQLCTIHPVEHPAGKGSDRDGMGTSWRQASGPRAATLQDGPAEGTGFPGAIGARKLFLASIAPCSSRANTTARQGRCLPANSGGSEALAARSAGTAAVRYTERADACGRQDRTYERLPTATSCEAVMSAGRRLWLRWTSRLHASPSGPACQAGETSQPVWGRRRAAGLGEHGSSPSWP